MHLDLPDELISRIERCADPRQGLTAAEVVSRAMDNYELVKDPPERSEEEAEQLFAEFKSLSGLMKGTTLEELLESRHEGHRY